jgi:sphinganine-1-phosphate aldolase
VVDIFSVAQRLSQQGWYVSRINEPHGIHQMVNLAHETIVEEYIHDLTRAVAQARQSSSRVEHAEVTTY